MMSAFSKLMETFSLPELFELVSIYIKLSPIRGMLVAPEFSVGVSECDIK